MKISCIFGTRMSPLFFSIIYRGWLMLLACVVFSVAAESDQHRRRHHRGERRNELPNWSNSRDHRNAPQSYFNDTGGKFHEKPQSDLPTVPAIIPAGATLASNETLQEYARRNCTKCMQREEAKRAFMDHIFSGLLPKLRLASKPNVNASQDMPQMGREGSPLFDTLKQYGFQNDSPDGVFNLKVEQQDSLARTDRIYSFAKKPPSSATGLLDGHAVSYFNFSSESMRNMVREAKLNVYIRQPTDLHNAAKAELRIEIYEIRQELKAGTKNQFIYMPKGVPLMTKKIKQTLTRGSWQTFDLQEIVQRWFEKKDSNHGIHIRCTFYEENLAVHPSDEDSRHNMYLNILTEEGDSARRTRREAMNLDCREDGTDENRCCRYPLVIDFEKFGWDFVIAPKKYMAYYCSGSCPFKYLQRYVHTDLVNQALPDGSAGPCCHPTEMAPIMMVYLNDNKEVLVSHVPGMVATRCGCA